MVLSPLIAATGKIAADTLAPIVIETLRKEGGKILGIFGNDLNDLNDKTKQLIFNASQWYVKNYAERHGILKVLGMREPVDLDSVYTNVQFLNEREIRRFETTEALERAFRESQQRRFWSEKVEKQIGVEVANHKQYLMVLGGPGSGKSTFLRKMGLEALKGKKGGFKEHQCIPVFLELKRFTDDTIEIEKIIAEEFEICGFPDATNFTKKALKKGSLLILLDGLDEVPTKQQNRVIEQIQTFVDRHKKNRYIASCRTAAYRSVFRRFSDVAIAEFDDKQIEQFIKNWFCSEQDRQAKTAENCWELLNKNEYQGAKELAQTPLLLTFLCLVYDRSQNFPNIRSELYGKALRILLEEWAAEKRILRKDIYEGLSTGLEEILLSTIACQNFIKDKLFFHKTESIGQIKSFLAGNLNAPQHLDGEAVLKAIAVQQGILVERAEGVYSFSHLTLQEYLTAQYIADKNKIRALCKQVTNRRWKEVFLLVAGLARGRADELFLLMEKEAQAFLEMPGGQQYLVPLLQWAERETEGSGGELTPVAKRTIAYTYANANAYAYANARIYSNLLARANTLANSSVNSLARAYVRIDTNALALTFARAYALTKNNASAYIDNQIYTLANLIESARELKKLPPIYQNLNLNRLIFQLNALKSKVPNTCQSPEVYRTFGKQIVHTWLAAFHLTPEMVDIPLEELKKIDDYFYINWLIVQCKEAAVQVSPKTWAGIEERMLRVPS